jgi:hypothetical protein
VFCLDKMVVFSTFCLVSAGPCAPLRVLNPSRIFHFPRIFHGPLSIFCTFLKKPSHLSSKMSVCGLAGAQPLKNLRTSRAKQRVRKKPRSLSVRMLIFAPAGLKIVIPFERCEVEGRFALKKSWFRSQSRPKVVIPFERGESVFFFRR